MNNETMFETISISDSFDKNAEIIVSCSDTLEELSKLPDNFFKLIASSPPYNIGKKYETQVDLDQYLGWQTEIIEQLCRVTSETGSIAWQVGNFVHKGEIFPLDIYFYPIFKKFGFQLRNRIVWRFGHGLHASKRFSGRYEVLLWFSKTDKYTFNLDDVRVPSKYPGKRHYKGANAGKLSGNPKGKNPSDFWDLIQMEFDCGIFDIPNVKSNHPEKTIHPCQFPVELIERCVLAFTNKDDWILDPFGGVGSSVIAAIKHNRRGMMIDRDQDYVDAANERINAQLRGELKTRPLGKPVHTPTGKEKISQTPEEWLQMPIKKIGSKQ